MTQTNDSPALIGTVDLLRNGFVAGWAMDPARPDEPLLIEIWLDKELLCATRADEYRKDLTSLGNGEGRIAFHAEIPEVSPDQYSNVVVLAKSPSSNRSAVLVPRLQALGGDALMNELRSILPATNELKAQVRALTRAQEQTRARISEAFGKGGPMTAAGAPGSLAKIEETLETLSAVQSDLQAHAAATEIFLTRFDKLLTDMDDRLARFMEPKGVRLLRWTLGLTITVIILLAAAFLAVVYRSYFQAG